MVYLDYAATNPYTKFPCSKYQHFMNPNANYAHREKQLLHDCEERIKRAIGAKRGKVLFGGTSSQLVENVIHRVKETHSDFTIYTSVYEHNSFDRWAENSFQSIDRLESLLKDNYPDGHFTPIVFHQAVQNITGQIFDVKEIGELCHKYGAFYICDTTALWGHTALPDGIDDWCDMIVIDGHKEATELGIGCMWLSPQFNTWLGDMTLHGTPNLAGALAICDATEWAVKDIFKKENHAFDMYIYLKHKLIENQIMLRDICGDFPFEIYTPFINAIRLIGIDAFALQQYLSGEDIYIGIGQSSCAANEDYRQLCNGYNLTSEEAREVVRISFGEYSTYDDVDKLIDGVKEFKEKYL